ncbi:unknown protein [Streptococcus thermophilus LMG 18311]|uniref:Uncharacterized protein n=1 Tax=Streptococcus thermophilus (strain ATCC BAA-250 / LMG 18311) TaxID=264199 RepID=Q5M4A8_STRT2|nr:hypothetical protein [Streptococcus thermophilus]AAV60728.1 unknown protein [Streptococcus thermophilus LMG 18311]CAD0127407.1 conserved protein of unknown function [Streptococcus thermophilus]
MGEEGFGVVGHVDLSYKGRVYGYGSYDILSERLGGAIGDGVLFKAERQAYIDFCTQEEMTILGYQMVLTPEQEAAIEEQLDEIDKLLIPLNPSAEMVATTADGQPTEMYAYRIKKSLALNCSNLKNRNSKPILSYLPTVSYWQTQSLDKRARISLVFVDLSPLVPIKPIWIKNMKKHIVWLLLRTYIIAKKNGSLSTVVGRLKANT